MQKFLLSLLFFFSFAVNAQASGFNRDAEIARVRQGLESGRRVEIARTTERAIGNWVHTTARYYREHGYADDAAAVSDEWARFQGSLILLAEMQDRGLVGTREVPEIFNPLSGFLADWYHAFKDTFGEQVTHLMRIDDIQVLNYAIPVVFSLDGVLDDDGIDMDSDTYEVYFIPFAGVVAYWSVWGVCEGFTFGTGWVFLCEPAGSLAERITVRRIAPQISDRMFNLFWKE